MKILNDLVSKKACIVMPTYNERDNVSGMLDKLLEIFDSMRDFEMSLLVVDSYSPDGTYEIVESYAKKYRNIHLLLAKKEGLGKAYVRGFSYAVNCLKADYVLEMDCDFSHNPEDIPRLLAATKRGSDFVIGSRYIDGGSIPEDWGLMRKANSIVANLLARFIAGLGPVRDTTSGFRCISARLIKRIDLEHLDAAGYSFQMNLLFEATRLGARVREVPIDFVDRRFGESKLRMQDRTEFIKNAFKLRARLDGGKLLYVAFLASLSIILLLTLRVLLGMNLNSFLITAYLFLSVVMIVQSILNLYMTLYLWERPSRVERNKAPAHFLRPKKSFSILLPARKEEEVLAGTIESLHDINYPKTLMEIIVICEKSDYETIREARRTISEINDGSIKLLIFDDKPVNKPHALNKGLAMARGEIVTIYDAEDEVNPDILKAVNTLLQENEDVGIIQCGVQLMNYGSNWFSIHNVLEYYFWFKSRLHFHADIGMIPLGGNSVFFRRQDLEAVDGWDDNCLTEDADIGIRLSTRGIRSMVLYDEDYVTREETPGNTASFVRQRTRWVQGFLQVFLKFDWLNYPTLIQKVLAAYTLTISFLQALMVIMIPVSFLIMIRLNLGIAASIILILPLYLLFIQLAINLLGAVEFIRYHHLRVYPLAFLNLLVSFFPYQCILGLSSLRGLMRQLLGKNDWEKTPHTGVHRKLSPNGNRIIETYETANQKFYEIPSR
jgi:cellulose synthase/poly-beta-1,6-N-acetylglucosamine synthase-like glycosyltransferase